MKRAAQGFTIVELIVVIVIIGILATITITTFRGVQDRAYNTKIVSGVKSYRDALEIYYAQYGKYPTTTPEANGDRIAVVCLGTGYVSGTCGKISGTTVNEDATFNASIQAIFGSSPATVNDRSLPSGPEAFVGAVYGLDITSSSSTGYTYARTLQYALHGANANCILPGAWSYRLTDTPAVTACEIILEGLES